MNLCQKYNNSLYIYIYFLIERADWQSFSRVYNFITCHYWITTFHISMIFQIFRNLTITHTVIPNISSLHTDLLTFYTYINTYNLTFTIKWNNVSLMFLIHLFLLSYQNIFTCTSSALFGTHILLDESSRVLQLPSHLFKITING